MTKIVLKGFGLKALKSPVAEGEALVSESPISFLGNVNPETGIIQNHPLEGESVAGRVLVFPTGVGSTVGTYVIINLAEKGLAPRAMIQRKADTVTLIGAVVAGIPLIHRVTPDPVESIKTGDWVKVDSSKGIIEVEKKK
ncbi:MAG: DUF126 domain-containing protein [Candidatus Jordarchaeales archaeon]|nr:DUF126 domain-containing protein [Candidatus Jordarchaeia archaeon]